MRYKANLGLNISYQTYPNVLLVSHNFAAWLCIASAFPIPFTIYADSGIFWFI